MILKKKNKLINNLLKTLAKKEAEREEETKEPKLKHNWFQATMKVMADNMNLKINNLHI